MSAPSEQSAVPVLDGRTTTSSRVIRVDRRQILTADSRGAISTHALDARLSALDLCVGDFLRVSDGVPALLERSTVLRRSSRAHPDGQTIASNFDVVLLVVDASSAQRPALLERLATIGWDTGATPLFVFTKTDLTVPEQRSDVRDHVGRFAPGIDSVFVTIRTAGGTDDLGRHLDSESTSVMVGHSGVGKSSIVNALSSTAQQTTSTVRMRDGKGRHTTTSRQLISVGTRGFIIDTPGLRELGVQSAEAVNQTFDDVATLADGCRFIDCRHLIEPGCALRQAVTDGALVPGRLDAYLNLLREANVADRRTTSRQRVKDTEWNRLSRAYRKARGH